MGHKTYDIKVTDKNGTITVDPMEQTIVAGEAVAWSTTPDSDPVSLEILFNGTSGFSSTQYALNKSGGFGVIMTTPGRFSYTVTTESGRSLDPIIIVNPNPGTGA
jgi:hypothetical protein